MLNNKHDGGGRCMEGSMPPAGSEKSLLGSVDSFSGGSIPVNETRHKQVFFDGIMTYFGPLKNDETY